MDRHRFDAALDPEPIFYFDDNLNPNPSFHFDANPEPTIPRLLSLKFLNLFIAVPFCFVLFFLSAS